MRDLLHVCLQGTVVLATAISFTMWITATNRLECGPRTPVGFARYDMGTLMASIEMYYVDNDEYPTMAPLRNWLPRSKQAELRVIGGGDLSTIAWGPNMGALGLTTPVAYATFAFMDALHPIDGADLPYTYATANKTWILISCGPDKDYDILNPVELLKGDPLDLHKRLNPFTYDPTNGMGSDGDLWRIHNQ